MIEAVEQLKSHGVSIVEIGNLLRLDFSTKWEGFNEDVALLERLQRCR